MNQPNAKEVNKVSNTIIQIFSLIMYVIFLYWGIKLYRQILSKSGVYYLGALRMGSWTPTFLKYSMPLLLAVFALSVVTLLLSLAQSV